MRKLIAILAIVAAVALANTAADAGAAGFASFVAGEGAPINMKAHQETYRGNPLVVVSYSDTNSQTVIRTDVRRRGILADTSIGAPKSDTLWTIRGYTTGKGDSLPGLRARMTFRDEAVTFGKTYRYQARDSISGAALTAWSDSVSIVVTNFSRSQ